MHQGAELEGRLEWAAPGASRISLGGNVSLSDNHFVSYREVYGTSAGDTVRYDGNAIGFFPAVLGNARLTWAWRGLSLGGDLQHVGRIYLDNTEQRAASIAPHDVLDLEAGARIGGVGSTGVGLRARLNNVLDREYETGGYMDYDASGSLVPFRTPAAKRNARVEFRVDFQ